MVWRHSDCYQRAVIYRNRRRHLAERGGSDNRDCVGLIRATVALLAVALFIARRMRKRKREAEARRRAAEEAEAQKRRAALEAEAEKVRERCKKEDDKHACSFWFVRRESVLNFVAQPDERSLPSFQELQKRGGFLVEKTITRDGAFRASPKDEGCLAVSHRWFNPAQPDEDGLQLRKIKEHLVKHEELKFVWFDYWCMPQDGGLPSRSARPG